jgi:hypothetical protein
MVLWVARGGAGEGFEDIYNMSRDRGPHTKGGWCIFYGSGDFALMHHGS